MPVFRRVTLKLSGEALSGKSSFGIDQAALTRIAGQIHTVHRTGLQMAIVVGGGNIFRGASAAEGGMERSTADYAGMLATIINALALQDAIERTGIEVRTMSAIHVQQVAEPYIQRRAIHHLETGRIVVFAAGTGNPYMSTDTAAALRAVETGADVLLMAKNNVDGVYDADPSKVPDAQRFDELTYIEALNRRLEVMDSTALSLCMENHLPIVVFAAHGPSGIERAARGEPIGTWVGDVPRRLAEATPKAVGG